MSSFAQIERDRELWNPAIHWLLNVAPAELGERGNLGGTIGKIERGNVIGQPSSDPYSDYQLGWCAGDGPAEKWRMLAPVWFLMSPGSQAVLIAHYSERNDLPDNTRVAVSGALGKFACASLVVHEGEQLGKLLSACVDKGRGGRKETIAAAAKRTETAVRTAHGEWSTWQELLGDEPWERYFELKMVERLERAKPKPDDVKRWERDNERAQRVTGALRERLDTRIRDVNEWLVEHIVAILAGEFKRARRAMHNARWLCGRDLGDRLAEQETLSSGCLEGSKHSNETAPNAA